MAVSQLVLLEKQYRDNRRLAIDLKFYDRTTYPALDCIEALLPPSDIEDSPLLISPTVKRLPLREQVHGQPNMARMFKARLWTGKWLGKPYIANDKHDAGNTDPYQIAYVPGGYDTETVARLRFTGMKAREQVTELAKLNCATRDEVLDQSITLPQYLTLNALRQFVGTTPLDLSTHCTRFLHYLDDDPNAKEVLCASPGANGIDIQGFRIGIAAEHIGVRIVNNLNSLTLYPN